MDWKAFIANMLSDVAWPVVAVVAILFFRNPLKSLITKTVHFKGFGIDADFNQQAHSVAIEADRIISNSTMRGELTVGSPIEIEPSGIGVSETIGVAAGRVTPERIQVEYGGWGNNLKSLAQSSPRAVVTEAWIHVETELRRLVKPDTQRDNALSMLRSLITSEVLPPSVSGLIQDLRAMRNEVAHNSELDPGEDGAIAYLDACINVVTILKTISNDKTETVSKSSADGSG